MNALVTKYADQVTGTLSGWDRLVFRGYFQMLASVGGLITWLEQLGVALENFAKHAQEYTNRLKAECLLAAELTNRPYKYLNSPQQRKEEIAKQFFGENPVKIGLICVLAAVEPCVTFELSKRNKHKLPQFKRKFGKCLYLYQYWLDSEFGFMNARIQTWYPFHVQFCINGREWLSRKLDAHGIGYRRDGNCFPEIEDFERAQKLMNGMLRKNWINSLDRLAIRLNRSQRQMFPGMTYRWSAFQTEWATDVCFRSPDDLQAIYPQIVRGAITSFSGRDVLRFMGKRTSFQGEVNGQYRKWDEGIRVKHLAGGNSVKAYDKGGNLLRIETTVNHPDQFRVFRAAEGGNPDEKAWRALRRSVVDMKARSEVSKRCNARYAEGLASLDSSEPIGQLITPLCQPVRRNRTRYRGLRPFSGDDRRLLTAVNRGEFTLGGFSNREIAEHLYATASKDPTDRARIASRVSYRLRILRAHGLIHKMKGRRRYRLSPKGRKILTVILAAQNITLQQVNQLAA
jgi:hypothetical protein